MNPLEILTLKIHRMILFQFTRFQECRVSSKYLHKATEVLRPSSFIVHTRVRCAFLITTERAIHLLRCAEKYVGVASSYISAYNDTSFRLQLSIHFFLLPFLISSSLYYSSAVSPLRKSGGSELI